MRLYKFSSGKCLRIFEGHKDPVASVAISSNGRFALSGSRDHTLRLWEISGGKCLCTLEGHSHNVASVAISPDGRFGISGSHKLENSLRLWDLVNGRCLRKLEENSDEGHSNTVTTVAISPDSRFALSGSWDATLKLWAFDWELEARNPADWDEGAKTFLENFLTLHTPYAAALPNDREPTEEEIARSLRREGKPSWTEEDFQKLLYTLGCAGYGWLRPEGVKRELEKMAAEWEGPPELK